MSFCLHRIEERVNGSSSYRSCFVTSEMESADGDLLLHDTDRCLQLPDYLEIEIVSDGYHVRFDSGSDSSVA